MLQQAEGRRRRRRKTTTAVRVGVDELVPKKEAIEFC